MNNTEMNRWKKKCWKGVLGGTLLWLLLVAAFPVLLAFSSFNFRGEFPAAGLNPSQGHSSLAYPQTRVGNLGEKWVASPGKREKRDGIKAGWGKLMFQFGLTILLCQALGFRQNPMLSLLGWRKSMSSLHLTETAVLERAVRLKSHIPI